MPPRLPRLVPRLAPHLLPRPPSPADPPSYDARDALSVPAADGPETVADEDGLAVRAWRDGLSRLATSELAAIVLGRGDGGPRRCRQAQRLLGRLGGIARAAVSTPDELLVRGLLPP